MVSIKLNPSLYPIIKSITPKSIPNSNPNTKFVPKRNSCNAFNNTANTIPTQRNLSHLPLLKNQFIDSKISLSLGGIYYLT